MSRTEDSLRPLWEHASELVLRARCEQRASSSNEALRHFVKEDPSGPLAPLMLAWIADNLVFDKNFEEAIGAYERLLKRHGRKRFRGLPWGVYALEQMAHCHARLGRLERAVRELSAARALPGHQAQSWLHFRSAQVLEEGFKDRDAQRAYRRVTSSADDVHSTEVPLPELARRAADRLAGKRPLEAFPDRLATALVRALETRDVATLARLASRTHFSLGVAGSEIDFLDFAKLAPYLKQDLGRSKVVVDPAALLGSGGKLYLDTDGWSGKLLSGRVYFILARVRDGWEWRGVALTQINESFLELIPPAVPQKNQPLQLPIKAPYPQNACFRAGGLTHFLESFLPFIGGYIMLSDLFSSCGYGPGGFYYNQGPTHRGREAFAIDFTHYQHGLAFRNTAGGVPVLAVQAGIVSMVRSNITSGDSSLENRVQIDHPSLNEVLGLIFGIPLPAQLKYQSWYLHLAGPGQVLVSLGMWVQQGARLGPINDTGNSAFDHLHFSLHDRDIVVDGEPYGSIRPTPMDGHALGDGDGGVCLCSTNVPVP
jgi:murein DD-endopeptidase MepM/ murein hydrolase activator NlpD